MKRFMIVAMCVFCCVFIFSPVVVLSAPAWQTKFRDNDPVVIGSDADISIAYDETTDDRLEIGDGSNLFLWLKDLGTTGSFGLVDNSVAAIGSDSDFQITYDETTDDRLEVSDGTNLFLWLKDLGTTARLGLTDNSIAAFGTDMDIQVAYDAATDNRLEWSDGTNLLAWLTDGGTTGTFGTTGSIVTTGALIEDTDNEDLVLRTNANANQIVLDSAGNVGIGTDAPGAKLDVLGATYGQLRLTASKSTTVQRCGITSQPYDSAVTGRGIGIMSMYSDATTNQLIIGGGATAMDAATLIRFYVGATSSTQTGIERLTLTYTDTVFNDPSADVDFRVESDGNANMIFVDGGNNKVGIGTGTVTDVLTVAGDADFQGGDIQNSTGTTISINEDLWTGVYEAVDHSINLRCGAANDSYLNFYEADANNGGAVWYDGGDEALYIGTRNASATPTAAITIPDGTTNVTILGGVTTGGSWDNNGENVYLGVHGASFEGLRINVVNSTGECFLLPEDDDDGLVFGIKPQTANNGDAEIAFFPSGTAINGTGLGKFIVYDPGTTTETFKVMADTGATSLGGKIDKYNNVATEGYGVGAIVDNVELTGQTGTVASADCSNAGTAGQYRVDYYLVVTTTEAGDSVAANITWNDGTAARTVTSSSVATDATNYTQGSVYCRLGSGSVAYSTTYTGTRTTAIYSLYLTCTRLN